MNGLVHLVQNVARGISQIDLGPLAAVAAIVPGLAPAIQAGVATAGLAAGGSFGIPQAATAAGLIQGVSSVAIDPTLMDPTASEHSLGLGYTSPYSDIALGIPIPGSDVVSTLIGGLTSLGRSLLPGLFSTTGAGTSAADSVGIAGQGAGILGALGRAFPAIESVVPKILLRAAPYAALAAGVYELYKNLRAQGMTHKAAKRTALRAAGIRMRRRRMRATNIHALRRSIRRVHAFRKIAAKVGALHVGRRRLLSTPHYRRRRYRRGDVDPFLMEDRADMADEAEDFDMEPEELAYE